jgi:NTE family protein
MNKHAIALKDRFKGLRDMYTHYALVLQGGGALGAYQAGVYQALQEAELNIDWVAGISIGAINGAIIAGNAPEDRVERLTAFWNRITTKIGGNGLLDALPLLKGNHGRSLFSQWSAGWSLANGQPGFFTPRLPTPHFWPPGTPEATSFYDTAALKTTLEEMVDFDRINSGETRLSIGAVNVRSGNFVYFDNHRRTIRAEHVMASCALPPSFPAVEIDGELYWDGGLISNTPLHYVIGHEPRVSMLIFQVDLWNPRGEAPRDLTEVAERRKHIIFSSRTRHTTAELKKSHDMRRAISHVLKNLPADKRNGEDYDLLRKLSCDSVMNIIHLVYRSKDADSQAKDYEFSVASKDMHWSAGYTDTRRTLRHRDWLEPPPTHVGVVTHDLLLDSDD